MIEKVYELTESIIDQFQNKIDQLINEIVVEVNTTMYDEKIPIKITENNGWKQSTEKLVIDDRMVSRIQDVISMKYMMKSFEFFFNFLLLPEDLAKLEEYQPHRYKNYELECYKKGFIAALVGKTEDNNPYPLSGHERDTTFMDECNFAWHYGNECGINYLTRIRKERE